MSNTFAFITKLPQVRVTYIDELEFAVDYFAQRYEEISLYKVYTWQLYNDAIDNEAGTEMIRQIGELAAAIELEVNITWLEWQNAKRDFFAINN